MTVDQLVILAVVQGLTEFLPVSSSGHLNLVHLLADYPDQGPLIDIALHVGSLLAVLVYFWRDVVYLAGGLRDVATLRRTAASRLVLLLALASLPLALVGVVMLATGLIEAVRSLAVIAWTTIIFGLLLWACDRLGASARAVAGTRLRDAVIVGLAQAVAVIPGVSRSGITMTAARGLGYERTEAARLSMLLAIPAILMSGAGALLDLGAGAGGASLRDILLPALLAAATAFASIWFMMALLRRVTMTPFVVYRILLGIVLLWFAYA